MSLDKNSIEYCQVKENDLPDNNFESCVEEFTEYYCTDSLQDIREKLVRMYLIKHRTRVIGYVTLAMAHIRHDATEPIKAKQVNGNIPALLISHLAVHKDFQRQGVGTMLLDLVFRTAPKLESLAGRRYVMLNPRDDQGVRNFYTKYGFTYHANLNDDKHCDAFLMDLKVFYD